MNAGVKVENGSSTQVTLNTPLLGVVCCLSAVALYSLPVHKMWRLALAVLEISLRAAKFKAGHVTLTTLILRVICHPNAGTWHMPYLYFKIWPLWLQSFQRCAWCRPKFKWFTWPDNAPFRDGLSSAASSCYDQPNLKSNFNHYQDTKGYTKYQKWGDLG